jgi:hypothetical protein
MVYTVIHLILFCSSAKLHHGIRLAVGEIEGILV